MLSSTPLPSGFSLSFDYIPENEHATVLRVSSDKPVIYSTQSALRLGETRSWPIITTAISTEHFNSSYHAEIPPAPRLESQPVTTLHGHLLNLNTCLTVSVTGLNMDS